MFDKSRHTTGRIIKASNREVIEFGNRGQFYEIGNDPVRGFGTKTMPGFYMFKEYQAFGNWFGNGVDGDVIISSDTNLSAVEDGDMILKQYSSLIINEGFTLTTDNRCRGLFIYVSGNCTINGILSMSARGGYVNPGVTVDGDGTVVGANGLRLPMLVEGETDTLVAAEFDGAGMAVKAAVANQKGISGNGKIFVIQREGAAGAAGGSGLEAWDTGLPGVAGGVGESGGGGGGRCHTNTGGAGAAGTCFSGGSGGGGQVYAPTGPDASLYGGPGGDSNDSGYNNQGGGAGNPGGSGDPSGTKYGENGTGGLLFLIVGGNLTVGATGIIKANGSIGNEVATAWGGCSGGGNIIVLYAGILTNDGTIQANGGVSAGDSDGGAGSVQISQVDR